MLIIPESKYVQTCFNDHHDPLISYFDLQKLRYPNSSLQHMSFCFLQTKTFNERGDKNLGSRWIVEFRTKQCHILGRALQNINHLGIRLFRSTNVRFFIEHSPRSCVQEHSIIQVPLHQALSSPSQFPFPALLIPNTYRLYTLFMAENQCLNYILLPDINYQRPGRDPLARTWVHERDSCNSEHLSARLAPMGYCPIEQSMPEFRFTVVNSSIYLLLLQTSSEASLG